MYVCKWDWKVLRDSQGCACDNIDKQDKSRQSWTFVRHYVCVDSHHVCIVFCPVELPV